MSLGLLAPALPMGATQEWSVGNDANDLRRLLARVFEHATAAVSARTVAQQFSELEATWLDETAFVSSTEDLVRHPSYQRVIGLGPSVVPIILHRLESQPEQWFFALSAITGADPVHESHRGDVAAMANDWVNWGRLTGLVA